MKDIYWASRGYTKLSKTRSKPGTRLNISRGPTEKLEIWDHKEYGDHICSGKISS